MIDTKTEDLLAAPTISTRPTMWSPRVRWLLILLIVLLGGFFLVKKGYVVAAVVNGKPIFRWEVNTQLMSRFGQQTLESMITERLIAEAALKEGITVTKADIDAKITSITTTLGPNVNLDQLLTYQ